MKIMDEFKEFAVRGNVVDMAVGVIIGGAFGKIVSSFLNDVMMPPLGMLSGGVDFTDKRLVLKEALDDAKAVTLNYGSFITTVVDFTILAFAVFMLVKGINHLRRDEAVAPKAPTDKACSECLSTIPIKARRCSHCTQLQPA